MNFTWSENLTINIPEFILNRKSDRVRGEFGRMKRNRNTYPHHIEKSMEDFYVGIIKKLSGEMTGRIKKSYESNIKIDASFRDMLKTIVDETTEYLKSIYMSHMVGKVTKNLIKWTQNETMAWIEKTRNMPRRDFAELAVKYAMDDPIIQTFSADYIQKNVQLVEDLGKDYIDGVAQAARDSFVGGGDMKTLAETMSVYTEGDMAKAAFWARDQVGDAYSAFTESMHKKAGFPNYYWRTTGDSRVRGMDAKDETSHVALNGMIFSWARGAAYTGQLSKPGAKHPGFDYNCRCTAEPTFDAAGDEL
jgi:SPP1 gp7 family putative phage head morphogenesis protein